MILRRPALTVALALAATAVGAASSSSGGDAGTASSPKPADAATATVDRFHAALKAGDGKTALALLSPSLLVYESGHVERSRDEYEAQHLQADMDFVAKATTTLVARRSSIDGPVAQVTSESTVTSERDGKPVRQHSLETIVLRNTREGWRITHIHWSSRTLRESDPAPK